MQFIKPDDFQVPADWLSHVLNAAKATIENRFLDTKHAPAGVFFEPENWHGKNRDRHLWLNFHEHVAGIIRDAGWIVIVNKDNDQRDGEYCYLQIFHPENKSFLRPDNTP